MKRIIKITLTIMLCFCLTGCSKIFYHFNDVVSFRLENESELNIYAASVFFGTKDTVLASMSGENADGTALANQGKECLVFPIEQGDMNDTKLEDMIFEFFCTHKKRQRLYLCWYGYCDIFKAASDLYINSERR